ncbi:hypothetical protein [Thalassoglobus polymorphus]|uniref:Uncharacterized protein n=1 Tax=Thalassoglobus polymorphus TaxID=2527994 RepID=A0A517QIE9_9PLAN|nr:hypothetical protein [Thalassoglobus polymorphus]QDT31384.1 hypothetical protein Mal48_06170 [Thalassoglobus polymorphus]
MATSLSEIRSFEEQAITAICVDFNASVISAPVNLEMSSGSPILDEDFPQAVFFRMTPESLSLLEKRQLVIELVPVLGEQFSNCFNF